MFTLEEFAEALGISVEDITAARFDWLLAEAEVLIRSYRPDLPEDTSQWPKAAVVVAMRVMRRAVESDVPAGMSGRMNVALSFTKQEQFTSDASSGALYLTKADRLLLRGRGRAAFGVDLMPKDRPWRQDAMRHVGWWN